MPLFVATGHLGRSIVSCDDGRSWVEDRSDVPDGVCWPEGGGGIECDHQPTANRGLTWGNGHFFATFGWGEPGNVRRSDNGVDWEPITTDTTYGGVAYEAGVLLLASSSPRTSKDDGATFGEPIASGLAVYNVRRAGSAAHDGGRFVLVGEDGDVRDVAISADGGQTYFRPDTLPAICGASLQTEGGIAYGNGAIVIVGGTGDVCWSTDGGLNFSTTKIAESVSSTLVWDGDEFLVWNGTHVFRSGDGESWTPVELTTPTPVGPVAASPAGTLVAVRGGWQVWYEAQEFYRSTDGVTWETLAADQFTGGHPLRFVQFGYGKPSASCPAP